MHLDQQATFRALADPTRRQILMHLADGEMTIGELVDEFAMTRAAVRKHLSVLEQGQLVRARVSGRERINSLQPEGLRNARAWLDYFDQFWDEKLDRLSAAIAADKGLGGEKHD